MTSAPAHAARTLKRSQIVDLARQGTPWQSLPILCQALRQVPMDAGLRFLAASGFARLGLTTPAVEHLDRLPPELSSEPEVISLRASLAAPALDRIETGARIETCRANLAALEARGIDLGASFESWAQCADRHEFFRARDGNVVRRARDGRDAAQWRHLADIAGMARAFVESSIKGRPDALARPFTVEGADPPWLLRDLHAALPREKDGYWPAVRLVQADVYELLDGLSLAPLQDVLSADRLAIFVGEDAPARVAEYLASRDGTTSVGPLLTAPAIQKKCEPSLDSVMRGAERARAAVNTDLLHKVRSLYEGRTPEWWNARYDGALSGRGDKLRVLIPTCRYSTFIRHSSSDLCGAFERAGFEPVVLIEPDDFSRFSTAAYLRAFAEFQPDLVVLINYTRANMNARAGAGGHLVIPDQVPYVCWLQDAMPHQFEPGLGAKAGPLDFLAGHLHEELFSRFGFSRDRACGAPVVASEEKFHPGPVAPDVARRLSCDVAYVSHHSETPEAMHERLKREAAADPRIPRVFDALLPTIRSLAAHPEKQSISWALRETSLAALREHLGQEPEPRTLSLVHRCYALPLADRLVRHETLRWAAELCEERGWKLHVYGRGWETHRDFSRYAKGELAHDEELRAAYACAAVHLHASSGVQLHQRVLECFLSGGVALSRLLHETVRPLRQRALLETAAQGRPSIPSPCGRHSGFAVADHPELIRWTFAMQRLGLMEPGNLGQPLDGVMYLYPKDQAAEAPECATADLLGDLADTCFTDKPTLATLIAAHVGNPARRRNTSASVSSRAKEKYTHRAFAGDLVRFVRASLAGP